MNHALSPVAWSAAANAVGAKLEPRALGSDPLAALDRPDPFFDGLATLAGATTLERDSLPSSQGVATSFESLLGDLASPAPHALYPDPQQSDAKPTPEADVHPLRARGWARTRRLDEIEVPAPEGWLDWLLEEDERKRLEALAELAEGETPYDRFGLSNTALRSAFPFFSALYRLYFRVRSERHEALPASGPCVLASNHAGLLPFDGAMLVMDVLLHSDPPRLARAIVDRWVGGLPWLNVFFARVGQVIGTRENFADLLSDGQLVLVFPEGMAGIRKRVTQRYRVQRFHVGFVEHALRAQAPVVPVAVIGSDDQAPILFDVKPLAKALGLPFIPITPTFPLLGPMGLLPYPVGYRIVYGEPLCFHDRFGPEDADDPRLVRYLARQVRRAVQSLIDRHRQ